jgi:ribosomal protein S18 acetylase RimI-like enzyme
MLGDPSFDAQAWFLTFEGDRLVGAVLNWKEGYVKDLVVHPDSRGRGLGKGLMLQTFGEFARRGVSRITLKTDSINPTQAWRWPRESLYKANPQTPWKVPHLARTAASFPAHWGLTPTG